MQCKALRRRRQVANVSEKSTIESLTYLLVVLVGAEIRRSSPDSPTPDAGLPGLPAGRLRVR
jgi:hypothetical protein